MLTRMTEESQHAKRDKDDGNRPTQPAERDHESNRQRSANRSGHRKRVPGTQRHERTEDRTATTLLHSERHRKQPAHSWIDAMKCAERHQHRPR
jgi:hypothetical protein